MEITLEMIDAVRERTGADYAEAKEALEKSGGSVVDAIVLLEKKSRINTDEIIGKIKALVKEGNVNKIRVKRGEQVLLTVPVNVGILGGLVGLGIGRVVELFDPPDKDDFLPPRIAGALGGAVLGGFFGGELQKERFPRLGRHWRATVAPSNGAASVSVDLGLHRGSWKTNQAVRVLRDRETGIISLAPNRALPTVDAEERK